VGAVLPVDLPGIHQPQIGFIDQRRRLWVPVRRPIGPLTPQVVTRIVAWKLKAWEQREGPKSAHLCSHRSNPLAGSASRSGHTREIGMPHGCQRVFRIVCAGNETDSARRRSVPQPTAIVPTRCRVSYCEWPATARCGGPKPSPETATRVVDLLTSIQIA